MLKPDRLNDIDYVIKAFERRTKSAREDVMADIICDLCLWADREGLDPLRQIERGIHYYEIEVEENY